MALMRDKSISNEKEDFGALNRPQFSLYFSRLGDTRDRLSCNSDAPSSGNKLTSYFLLTIGFWPSDICTPPKIHSLSAQFVGLPPLGSRCCWKYSAVQFDCLTSFKIISPLSEIPSSTSPLQIIPSPWKSSTSSNFLQDVFEWARR